jgi:aminoglycoside 3-N-acetyltransferase I
MALEIVHITSDESSIFGEVLEVFAIAFDDAESYLSNQPHTEYLRRLLDGNSFICLAARKDGKTVGGIAAYELMKFEQQRSEIYMYDLAVSQGNRREGIATAMIEKLKEIARSRGAYVIFVQADTNAEDLPARALYSKLGKGEDVLHFDIDVKQS